MRGIVTVNIGGEIRTLSLKNNFLVLLAKHLNVDPLNTHDSIADMIELNPLRALTVITYCGLIANYERNGNYEHYYKDKEILTIPVLATWVDDADEAELESVWQQFREIMEIPQASEAQIKQYEENLKKNLIPTSMQAEQPKAAK